MNGEREETKDSDSESERHRERERREGELKHTRIHVPYAETGASDTAVGCARGARSPRYRNKHLDGRKCADTNGYTRSDTPVYVSALIYAFTYGPSHTN